MKKKMNLTLVCAFLLLLLHLSYEQQIYLDNKQLDCYSNLYNFTLGYTCNGASSSCLSYLTFRSIPPYNSPTSIAYLLGSTPNDIATANNISDVDPIPSSTIIIVPVNCSCSGSGSGPFYQHNASYILKSISESYLLISNDTYQGLTTCQSMMSQNPQVDSLNFTPQLNLTVPLRCACPTPTQASTGIKFLLTYLVTWKDTISSIAQMFGLPHQTTILDANLLSDKSIIYPFTPILVPLHSKPRKIDTTLLSSPPSPTVSLAPAPSHHSNKWVFIGIAIGTLLLLTLSALLFFYFRRRRWSQKGKSQLAVASSSVPTVTKQPDFWNETSTSGSGLAMESKSWSISPQGVQHAIESLIVYKLEELQKATDFFSEEKRMKGSVYRGLFKGDDAAVKVMKGKGGEEEIKVLKRINHRNIIRLSGYCVDMVGNTYLVYEYAENGCLRERLNENALTWKQRVQIACDIADALNYLHSYISPPYIHNNLTTNNILLDGSLRAKISNFGSARSMEHDHHQINFTRHVIGTQGYMAPEYIENGLITPKLDVFAFGVVLLELLSGKEAITLTGKKNGGGEELLSTAIREAIDGDGDVMKKFKDFMDPSLGKEYLLELAFSMAQLAKRCVDGDLNTRPTMSEAFMSICKIFSSSLDWDPSDQQLQRSASNSNSINYLAR